MRITLMLAVAVVLAPAALTVEPAAGSGASAPITDVSAAKKKQPAKKAKVKEEYLKAAPGTGPSGPKK